MSSLENLDVNINSSIIIHNNPKLETIQMSIKWLMDKWNVLYPSEGILFGNKEEQRADAYCSVDLKAQCKWRQLDTKDHMVYDFIYMKCPQKANL